MCRPQLIVPEIAARSESTHNLVVDLDELTNVGKGMTEVMEQLPEVGARLTLVGVGPELERESRAELRVSP
jgi:hypothetical protein